jgi:hypothetical protein
VIEAKPDVTQPHSFDLGQGVVPRVQARPEGGRKGRQALGDHREDQVVLVREVAIEGSGGISGSLSHFPHREGPQSHFEEDGAGRVENDLANLAPMALPAALTGQTDAVLDFSDKVT